MEKLGTEKIEEIASALAELAILIKKISEDKKVGIEDLSHLITFLPKVNDILSAFSNLGGVVEEGKDIDVAEVIALIQKIHSKVKEVEKA